MIGEEGCAAHPCYNKKCIERSESWEKKNNKKKKALPDPGPSLRNQEIPKKKGSTLLKLNSPWTNQTEPLGRPLLWLLFELSRHSKILRLCSFHMHHKTQRKHPQFRTPLPHKSTMSIWITNGSPTEESPKKIWTESTGDDIECRASDLWDLNSNLQPFFCIYYLHKCHDDSLGFIYHPQLETNKRHCQPQPSPHFIIYRA